MKTHEYLAEAGILLASLMDGEGVLTDDDEARLEAWAAGTDDKLGAWRAVYRRAEAEAQIWKAERARIAAIQKRAEALMVRAKLAGVELLEARAELGESTTIKGVCFLRKTRRLRTPERLDLWPPEMLIAQDPKPDRVAALEALKAGRDVGEGFYLEDRSSITWR
jgi:hypothetical protein